MTLFLNLILLLVGTTATLAAFGGETWTKGAEPLPQRITYRGWLSVVCLATALFLGTVKELMNFKANLMSQAEAETKAKNAKDSLDAANWQLTAAANQLTTLQNSLSFTREQLSDTKDMLGLLKSSLNSAKNQLSAENDVNLVTVLAHGYPVRYATFMLWLAPTSLRAKDTFEVLFSNLSSACKEIAVGTVSFTPSGNIESAVTFSDQGSKGVRTVVPSKLLKESPSIYVPPFADQDGTSQHATLRGHHLVTDDKVFILDQELPNDTLSAADAYGRISNHIKIGSLTLSAEKEFADSSEANVFFNTHPWLWPSHLRFTGTGPFKVVLPLPQSCLNEVSQYWVSTLNKGKVFFFLATSASMSISAEISSSFAKRNGDSATLDFYANIRPEFQLGNIQMGKKTL